MGTVSKALILLEYFTRSRPEIGLSDLARLAGMNKATVYRLVTELQSHGFVEQTNGRIYRVGPAVLRLAALREATVPRRAAALQALQTLSDRTGETAHLSQLQGDRLVTYAYTYAQAHGTSVRMEDAEILPFHATSSGLAVLAFAEPAFCDQVLAGALPALTPETPTDPAEIRAHLDQIRATGLSESSGGFERDVHSLAVPLFDDTAACTAAVAVAAPAARMTPALRATIVTALQDTARTLIDSWGGVLPSELQVAWSDAA